MRIGIVSTRFAGLDGVSLESIKIATVLKRSGHEVAWFAGDLGKPFTPGMTHPAAHFSDPGELARQTEYFGQTTRRRRLINEVREEAETIEAAIRQFVTDHSVDVLMPQNALAIPMQVPLAMAITDVISEGIPALAHHHDFAWERERFTHTAIQDLLDSYFPPRHPSISHLVINSLAREQMARRRGLTSAVLPNVMDFGSNNGIHRDGERFRAAAGLSKDQVVLLQPTRVIPRKSIETTIDLARRFDDAVVVITHEEGDEGFAYGQYLKRHAELANVDLRFVPVGNDPTTGPTLADAYASAHLVVYPSRIEGFGNALLEAFFYRRPVLVRRYPVYVADIAPTGVQCLEITDHLTDDVAEAAKRWIENPDLAANAIEQNYEIGRRHFSLEVAQEVVDKALDSIRL